MLAFERLGFDLLVMIMDWEAMEVRFIMNTIYSERLNGYIIHSSLSGVQIVKVQTPNIDIRGFIEISVKPDITNSELLVIIENNHKLFYDNLDKFLGIYYEIFAFPQHEPFRLGVRKMIISNYDKCYNNCIELIGSLSRNTKSARIN